MARRTFSGTVIHGPAPGVREAAQVAVDAAALVATTAAGERFVLPYAELQLERGAPVPRPADAAAPAGERTIFCWNVDRTLALGSAAPGFVHALARAGGRHIRGALPPLPPGLNGPVARRVAGVVAGGVALALLAFALPPLLARSQVWLARSIPATTVARLGAEAWAAHVPAGDALVEPALDQVLAAAVAALGPDAAGTPMAVHPRTAVSPEAYALPSGDVVLHRGLLQRLEDADELVAVLAHEAAHVRLRHGIVHLAQAVGAIGTLEMCFGDLHVALADGGRHLGRDMLARPDLDDVRAADARAWQQLCDAGLAAHALPRLIARLAAAASPNEDGPWADRATLAARAAALAGRAAPPVTRPLSPGISWTAVRQRLAPPAAPSAAP